MQNGQPQRFNDESGRHQNRENGRQPGPINIPMTVSEQFRESWLTAIIGSILFAAGMCLLFWNETLQSPELTPTLTTDSTSTGIKCFDYRPSLPEGNFQLARTEWDIRYRDGHTVKCLDYRPSLSEGNFQTGQYRVGHTGRAVKVAHSLDEALHNVAVLSNTVKVLPEFEGQLVYLSGPLTVSEPLTEPDYGILVASIKLKRRVQMYQWIEIEEERSFGGVTEDEKQYYYTTEWKDKLVDSDRFYIRTGHHNPPEIPVKSQVQIADEVKIGAITLGTELKQKFNDFVEVTSDERPERKDIKMHSGLYYYSADLWNPQVGDIRIQFSYAGKAGDVYSVVGMQLHGAIVPYRTTHGDEVLLQRKHKLSVDQMFHLEHVHNYWRTWTIRGLGWLVLFLAATCLANILRTLIQNSTFLCGLIAIESVTMSVSMSISLLVIGFAWVWYRPIIGLCLALASILPFLYSTLTSGLQFQQRDNYRRL